MVIAPDALVAYRGQAARVTRAGAQLNLHLPNGTAVRVQRSEVVLLHPGPVRDVRAIHLLTGDAEEVWSVLEGEALTLQDLAELAFGAFTPGAALTAWQWVGLGEYFAGTPQRVVALTSAERTARQEAKEEAARQQAAREAWLAELRAGRVADRTQVQDVEAFALGHAHGSPTLRALRRPETPQEAHRLLLELGVWDTGVNPHPQRLGVDLRPQVLPCPAFGDDPRVDLNHLMALAIDDADARHPDDAVTLEQHGDGWRLWVHVADVAALVPPGSAADLAAQVQGATTYLPEGAVTMLPDALLRAAALLEGASRPALSFELTLNAAFEPVTTGVHLSRVQVTRVTYSEAQRLAETGETHCAALLRFAAAARANRAERGAVLLDLPEVHVRVQGGEVQLIPRETLGMHVAVEEAMLLAGWAAATWATERGLPLPFAAQTARACPVQGEGLAEQWARRKALDRTRLTLRAHPHAGTGLDLYVRVTSPLRRYVDLLAHQQLRAALLGHRVLRAEEVSTRALTADLGARLARRAEGQARRHWTLVHLLRVGGWRGAGTVVEHRPGEATVLLPTLGLTVLLPLSVPLGSTVGVSLTQVDLPNLRVAFAVDPHADQEEAALLPAV